MVRRGCSTGPFFTLILWMAAASPETGSCRPCVQPCLQRDTTARCTRGIVSEEGQPRRLLGGSPFGSSSFCTSVVLKRVEKIRDTLSALKSLQDSQIPFTLLRACLALPKISFALRTCARAAFDEGMREALSDIVGAPVPEWSWQKASLPCSMGGLGLRRASLHARLPILVPSSLCLSLMSGILGHSP